MFSHQSNQLPYLKSLSNCLNRIKTDGYTANFKAVRSGLRALQTKRVYQPGEIKTVNAFRFEGISNVKENAIMYIIETCDGLKGTLVNLDVYVDPATEAFMQAVKNAREHGRH